MSRRRPRGKGGWIDKVPADVRTHYENEVLPDPRTTAKAARRWLLDHGVTVSLASVLRHRNWHARDEARRARTRAVETATRWLALEADVTDEELAAGQVLRNARNLFEAAYDVFADVYHTGRPAPPDQFVIVARALRAQLRAGYAPCGTAASPPSLRPHSDAVS